MVGGSLIVPTVSQDLTSCQNSEASVSKVYSLAKHSHGYSSYSLFSLHLKYLIKGIENRKEIKCCINDKHKN